MHINRDQDTIAAGQHPMLTLNYLIREQIDTLAFSSEAELISDSAILARK